MSMLADIAHWWGNDINAAANADILTVTGDTRSQQRVFRRLMTNPADDANNLPADYPTHPDYGAGLPRYVGSLATADEIAAVCIGQMILEDSVARLPPPTATVKRIADGLSVSLAYYDAVSGEPVALAFNVSI